MSKSRTAAQRWVRLTAIPLAGVLAVLASGSTWGQEAAPGWSEPVNLSRSSTQSRNPSLAIDPAGVVHVIWTEEIDQTEVIFYSQLGEGGWSEPIDVLMTPGGGPAYEPTMTADSSGYLHVVWRGSGTVFYSGAYAPAAGSTRDWSTPQIIAALNGSGNSPDLVVDRAGAVHVVYSQPPGSDSGIYYVNRSERGGSWQAPVPVYARSRNDRMVTKPRIAVGTGGTLYVVWVETGYPNTFPPLGIRGASSTDGGRSWSLPVVVADGPYDEPGIAVRDQKEVHVVWSGTSSDRFKFHRWARDGLNGWSLTWRNTDLGGSQGRPALVLDSDNTLHWLMVGTVFSLGDEGLYYAVWQGDHWSSGEVLLQDFVLAQNLAQVSAAVGAGNQLHVAVQFPITTQGDAWQNDIIYLHHELSSPGRPAQALPAPTGPEPTLTATVSPALPVKTVTPGPPTLAPVVIEGSRFPSALGALTPVIAAGVVPVILLIGLVVLIRWRRKR